MMRNNYFKVAAGAGFVLAIMLFVAAGGAERLRETVKWVSKEAQSNVNNGIG
ncbi:MAG: hypothetical protein Q7S01_01495 [bacterium]|nr:hypothetical protein [bacterium]